MQSKLFRAVAVAAVAFHAVPAAMAADNYPTKPMRFVVQFPAGGTSDVVARLVGAKVSEALKQPVVVENRVGAAGNIGADFVAKAAPDGYTILLANNTIVTNPAAGKVPFDPVLDFAPIASVGSIPIVLAVHNALKVDTLPSLIDVLKRNPKKYAYSSCGAGTAQHLAGELFKQKAAVDMVHVAYKGCNPAVMDGVSGQVPIVFNAISNVKPFAGPDGALKVLAVASEGTSLGYPSMVQAGLKDFDAQVWFGFLAPAKTPTVILDKLRVAIETAMGDPAIKQKLGAMDFEIQLKGPKEFASVIGNDLKKWSTLIKDAQIDVSP